MYEITVNRSFTASHAIRLHDGSVEPLHEHDWSVRVTVAADELDHVEVVMDFHGLQELIDRSVGELSGRDLNETEPFAGGRVNPTAERVAWWIGTRVMGRLPVGVRLVGVGVEEAPGCTATFRP